MTERARAVSGLCQPELSDRSQRALNYGEQIPELRGNHHPNYGETPEVELGGIEPPSARWLPNSLRPFLHCGLDGYRTGRSADLTRRPPPGLSPMSVFFHTVSGLSLRSIHASVAAQHAQVVRHKRNANHEADFGESYNLKESAFNVFCCGVLQVSERPFDIGPGVVTQTPFLASPVVLLFDLGLGIKASRHGALRAALRGGC